MLDLTGGEKIKQIFHSHSKGTGRKLSRGGASVKISVVVG